MTSAEHRLFSGGVCALQFKAQLNIQAFFSFQNPSNVFFFFFTKKKIMLNSTFSKAVVGF